MNILTFGSLSSKLKDHDEEGLKYKIQKMYTFGYIGYINTKLSHCPPSYQVTVGEYLKGGNCLV